jgi:hypothetical protein
MITLYKRWGVPPTDPMQFANVIAGQNGRSNPTASRNIVCLG